MKKKISGIKPFSECRLRSCYYHQLVAALHSFGINKDAIILNNFIKVQTRFKMTNKTILRRKSLARKMGYQSKPFRVSKESLIKSIDDNAPVIVAIDCYYLKYRLDTYMKKHALHFLLVYGYNLQENSFDVIDHDYDNSLDYKEKTMEIEHVLYANKKYREKNYLKRNAFKITRKNKYNENFFTKNFIPIWLIKNNKKNSEKNLLQIKYLINISSKSLIDIADKVRAYVLGMRDFYRRMSKVEFFDNLEIKENVLSDIANIYGYLMTMFYKIHSQKKYDFLKIKKEEVVKKIELLLQKEKKFYDFLRGYDE